MSVMLAECIVWAEEGGIRLRATPHADVVEISVLEHDSISDKVVATATIARWRWERIIQATLPPPSDLVVG